MFVFSPGTTVGTWTVADAGSGETVAYTLTGQYGVAYWT